MSERRASMGDKVYRGDVVKFIRNNISLGTFMKRTVKTADEACWDLCDQLNYVPAIKENPEQHWIPVTEWLPETSDAVLTTYIVNGDRSRRYVEESSYYGDDESWSSPWDEYRIAGTRIEVIAWMPLPEPFKGVTE